MKIHVAQGTVTLWAGDPYETDFLVTLATVFQEGGALSAIPSNSRADSVFISPAVPCEGWVASSVAEIDPDPAGANDPETTEILYEARGLARRAADDHSNFGTM